MHKECYYYSFKISNEQITIKKNHNNNLEFQVKYTSSYSKRNLSYFEKLQSKRKTIKIDSSKNVIHMDLKCNATH